MLAVLNMQTWSPYLRVARFGVLICCIGAIAGADQNGDGASAHKRQQVPNSAALEDAEKRVHADYRADFARAKLPGDKLLVAGKLLEASQAEPNPALRYVLLTKARDLSIDAGNAARMFQYIDVLAADFEIDSPTMQLESARKAAKLRRDPTTQAAISTDAIDRLAVLCAADQYDVAAQMATLAKNAAIAARNKHLVALSQHHARRLGGLQNEFAENSEHVQRLLTAPDDTVANTAVGLFYSLDAGDWLRGSAHLAAGEPGPLKAAGLGELTAPTAPEDQIGVGELWESAAREAPPVLRSAAESRARHWYELAAVQVEAAEKSALLTRIAKLHSSAVQLHIFVNDADGEGHLSITSERVKWRQLIYDPPTSVHINDYEWKPAKGDEVKNAGATQLFPTDVCFSSVQLTKVRGRGEVRLIYAEPTGVVIEVNDVSPPGSDDYEFIVRFREQ